jgi:RNA polymerase sigma-70 factor, ECF subfamily
MGCASIEFPLLLQPSCFRQIATEVVDLEVSSMPFENNTDRTGEPSALADCADERLVDLLVSGNHHAMSVIFDRYHGSMLRAALRILRDVGEAEDVVQVTLIDFYRNAKAFDPSRGNLGTWLLQYIYGRSINRLHAMKSRRHFDHVELTDVDPSELADDTGDSFRLSGPEARLFVQQILGLLDDKPRRVVELICFSGLTVEEVARITGDSKWNVQHHYYRSLEKLRHKLRSIHAHGHDQQQPAQKERSSWGLRKMSKSAEVLTGEVENAKAQIL